LRAIVLKPSACAIFIAAFKDGLRLLLKISDNSPAERFKAWAKARSE
jgi:hypothetical protein